MWTLSCTALWPNSSVASEGEAGLHAGAGEPDGEAVGVVVAAGPLGLGVGGAAELAAPPDERVLQQAPPLQVGQQAGDRPVDAAGVVACLGMLECWSQAGLAVLSP